MASNQGTQSIDFSDLGGKAVAPPPGAIDFSDLGGKPVGTSAPIAAHTSAPPEQRSVFSKVLGTAGEGALGLASGIGLPETSHASDFSIAPGLWQIARHPILSAQLLGSSIAAPQKQLSDQAEQELSSAGLANKITGAIHAVGSAIPMLGPAAVNAGEEIGQGINSRDPEQLAHGAGSALGQLAMLGLGTERGQKLGGAAVDKVAGRVNQAGQGVKTAAVGARNLLNPIAGMSPEELYQRGVKPRNSVQGVEPKIVAGLPEAARAANELGIDMKTMDHDDALNAIVRAKQNVWDQLDQQHLTPAGGVSRSVDSVGARIKSISDGMSDIAKTNNPGIAKTIEASADNYTGKNMTVQGMEQRIQELNNDLYGAQQKLKVQTDVLRKDPTYGAQFAELEGLRKVLNDTLDQVTGSGAKELKEKYGALKTMQDITERSRNIAERPSPVSAFGGIGRMSGLGNIFGGAYETLLGHPGTGLPAATKGILQMWYGKQLENLNNRNFLVSRAFQDTTPAPAPPVPAPAPVTPAQASIPFGEGPIFQINQTPGAPTPPPATSPFGMPTSTGPVPRNLTLTPGTAMTQVPPAPPIEGEYMPPAQPPAPPIAGALPPGVYQAPQHNPVGGPVPRQLMDSQQYMPPQTEGAIPAGPATTPAQTRPLMPWEIGRQKPLQLTGGPSQATAAEASPAPTEAPAATPERPRYVYRARPVGEQGITAKKYPVTTASERDARNLAVALRDQTGVEHQVIMTPTEAADTVKAGPHDSSWVTLNRSRGEHEIRVLPEISKADTDHYHNVEVQRRLGNKAGGDQSSIVSGTEQPQNVASETAANPDLRTSGSAPARSGPGTPSAPDRGVSPDVRRSTVPLQDSRSVMPTSDGGEGILHGDQVPPVRSKVPQVQLEPSLPGMEQHQAERAAVRGEENAADMTTQLTQPKANIESAAGEIEANSPLFRGTEASPQNEMFGGETKTPTGETMGRKPPKVRVVKTADLTADPGKFQWRNVPRSTIPEDAPWDQDKAGPIDVWRDPQDSSKVYVIDGHHRFAHAMRTGTSEVEARFHPEIADAAEAKRFGAERNLEMGNATPFDAANYLRQTGTTADQLKARGINLTGDVMSKGSSIAKLSDAMWEKYRTGELDDASAAAVGKLDTPNQQAELFRMAKSQKLSAAAMESAAQWIKEKGNTSTTTQSLFGDEVNSESNAAATIKLATKLKQQLAGDKAILKAVGNSGELRQAALARGQNIIKPTESAQQAMIAAQAADHFDNVKFKKGPVGDILDDAGRRVTQGEKLDGIFKEIYPKIREAIARELGQS